LAQKLFAETLRKIPNASRRNCERLKTK